MSKGARVVLIVLLGTVAVLGGLLAARSPERVGQPDKPTMVVYAPCGMTGPLTSAARVFRQDHPELELNVVYDNAIVLVRKIRGGDRPDVFIAPGELEMRQMVEEGVVAADSVRDFATLDLVVIAPTKAQNIDAIEDLTSPSIRTISLAHPDHNSVGYYGKAALESLGLWEPLKSKLLLREYPLEAVTLVTNGQVDAGITYLTCPLDTAPEKADASDVRIVASIPRHAYPSVRVQVGALKESTHPERARAFCEFLTSERAQEVVATQGLLPAKEIR